jgi:hypothetical protein
VNVKNIFDQTWYSGACVKNSDVFSIIRIERKLKNGPISAVHPLMVLHDFKELPPREKADITNQHGTYLMYRDLYGLKIKLYSIDDFFVEVWYHPELCYIQKIGAFKSMDRLEPYLDQIELSFA